MTASISISAQPSGGGVSTGTTVAADILAPAVVNNAQPIDFSAIPVYGNPLEFATISPVNPQVNNSLAQSARTLQQNQTNQIQENTVETKANQDIGLTKANFLEAFEFRSSFRHKALNEVDGVKPEKDTLSIDLSLSSFGPDSQKLKDNAQDQDADRAGYFTLAA